MATVRLRAALRRAAARVYAALPGRGLDDPVFVIGCGRSGTTAFGRALSRHRQITYLNEPRELWHAAYPEADIWSADAAARGARMALTAADADPARTRRLARLFRFETLLGGGPVLVEKLPINNFRLGFLHAMFPRARFLHIHRNGLEVARSIREFSERGGWFAGNPYKWDRLSAYAARDPATADLPGRCGDYFRKGLLEWRLSTTAALDFLRALPRESWFELSYRDLAEHPVEMMDRVIAFLGLPADPQVREFARESIARRTPALSDRPLTEEEERIGGPLLAASVAGELGTREAGPGPSDTDDRRD